jgi:Tfp pilus assembly protein PilF
MPSFLLRFVLVITLFVTQLSPGPANVNLGQTASSSAAREDAYRANNIGVALLEQFKYPEAAEQFRRALKDDPTLTIARINLAIALYNVPDLPGSLAEARSAVAAQPDAPQPHYLLGLIARAQNRTDDAIAEFRRVLRIDPRDVGANVNIGQILNQQRKYVEALPAARAAFDAEPYNVTAAYTLATALTRAGQRDEGQKMMQRFLTLRESGYATKIDKDYLDQGKYAEAIASTGAEPGVVDPNTPDVTFADATASFVLRAGSGRPRDDAQSGGVFNLRLASPELPQAAGQITAALGGAVVLFDFDSDGDLDMFETDFGRQRLYRNEVGKFLDVTASSGALASDSRFATGAIAGDYDNDNKPDLFVLRYGGSSLYRNAGNGRFLDVTAAAGMPAWPYLSISAALVDIDHDGDLDVFIAGCADLTQPRVRSGPLSFPADYPGAPNLLLRNNGNGRFSDITAEAKVTGGSGHAVAVVPTDFDNRRDIDLLVVNFDAAPALFRNLRDGTFADVAGEIGLGSKGKFTSAAAGDVNKDGYTDFYIGAADNPGVMAMSDGRGRFTVQPAPQAASDTQQFEQDVAQFLDYDNDGLQDLLRVSTGSTTGGLRLWRNAGGKWAEVTDRANPQSPSAGATSSGKLAARVLASGDLDGDGDPDIVVRAASGELRLLRNEGGNRNRFLRVQLTGKASNRNGVGSKIEIRAGSLRQKLETYAATPPPAQTDLLFGLGQRQTADALRVLWPSGIVQAETEMPKVAGQIAGTLAVTELDRKPSSCPYLYVWNGERFEFVTDFLGGGEMGYWHAPGVRNYPDSDEYVRIRDDQLRERDGRFEIRLTNELEEVLFVDRVQLVAVAHPADIDVYPNEGMVATPRPFKLFATYNARPPVTATDEHGHDVLAKISKTDRQYPDDFRVAKIRGYADEHFVTLDLGESAGDVLLMTAWTDYAFSSDNVAAHQSGMSLKPPSLQVKDALGRWTTVIENIGIPVGRPQTVPVDLRGKFLSGSREVRIVTNMRIYWDQILVATSVRGIAPVRMTRLDPSGARLWWRGFSSEATPDGREPFSYDYDRVTTQSPWKVMPGRYTREGDVRELVKRVDDIFVISRPGDEIAITFDATKLPPLPKNWKRTFLFYADGFSKEMDINSAVPDHVLPLPFHRMKSYPYAADERYPMTRARREYIKRYNTRVVREEVESIDALLVRKSVDRLGTVQSQR